MPRPEYANSVMLVRPMMTAPAAISRCTTSALASAAGSPSRATEPAIVVSPSMSNRSLMLIGRPSTTDRVTPAARSVSDARACASAESAYSLVYTRAPSPASSWARASAASVSATEVVLPSRRAKFRSFRVETIIVPMPPCGVKVRSRGQATTGSDST
ncbi:hypothetical protein D3C72_1727220 [compost metagenome]